MAFGGEGIARPDGMVHFIPFTLPQEIVDVEQIKVKQRFIRAKALHIIQESPHRTTPSCPHFTMCGGCMLQHATYAYQLDIKRQYIHDALLRIGNLSIDVPPVVPAKAQYSYRHHITASIHYHHVWSLCFTDLDKHLFSLQTCLLFEKKEETWINKAQKILASCSPLLPLQGRLRILKSNAGYYGALSLQKHPSAKEHTAIRDALLPLFNELWIEEMTPMPPTLPLSYGAFSCIYSPFAFLQNYPEQSTVMYASLPVLFQDNHTILDLYCGIGISSLFLAKAGKTVTGLEIHPHSLYCAQENARKNQLSISFICSSAEADTTQLLSQHRPDGVLVNPPKDGLSTVVVDALLASPSLKTLVYISCHPATLGRDIRRLQGFTIDYVQGYDMFPQTTHVETIVRLRRN